MAAQIVHNTIVKKYCQTQHCVLCIVCNAIQLFVLLCSNCVSWLLDRLCTFMFFHVLVILCALFSVVVSGLIGVFLQCKCCWHIYHCLNWASFD